jgi:hypothetical protein
MKTVENVSLRDSIEYIFGDKGKDRVANMSINNGVQNAQDLFMLCIKLMMGGITYVSTGGHPTEEEGLASVDIENLSSEQFQFVCHQMFRVGVQVTFSESDYSEEEQASGKKPSQTEATHFVMDEDPSKLENHVLQLSTQNKKYFVEFMVITHEEHEFS